MCASGPLVKHLCNHGDNGLKFHMETPQDGGTKVCSSGPGNITKMAATSILKKTSPEPER